jgi:hypothetical protein
MGFRTLNAYRNKINILFDKSDPVASKRQEKINNLQKKMDNNT